MDADERALLAAIIAQPDDDTVRLVYADWLQEHDQPERAEFIRVQCAYARLRYGSPEYERNGAELQSRSFDLDQEFAESWIAELDLPPNQKTTCLFRRGMVGAVWCSVRYFLNHAGQILSSAPIEWVSFRQLAAGNIDALARSQYIAKVQGVEFLLDGTSSALVTRYLRGVSTSGLQAFELTSLTVNSLSNTWTTRNVALGREIARTPGLSKLRRLCLRHAGVGEEGARALIESPHLTELTYLNLEDNGIGEEIEVALRRRFGKAVVLGMSDYERFTLGELGWD
jgi:uncharacterized protein (TIGR02996 family)